MKPSSTDKRKRLTLVLRVDLIDRVKEKADLLQQGPNHFVNLCVEGVLDAMEAKGGYDIPIVELYNQIKGKSFLNSKEVMTIVSAFAPDVFAIDQNEQRFLVELINKHQGPLTSDTFDGYRKLAQRMNRDRIEYEKQLRKIHPAQ